MSIYDNSLGEFAKVIPIQPGTNLDMTKFATNMWIDAQHTRWDNGFPRKMGGYELISYGNSSITRAIYVNIVEDNRRYIYMQDNGVLQVDVNPVGNVVKVVNRTPASWEPPDSDNNYNFSYTEFSLINSQDGSIVSDTYLYFVPLENAKNPYTNREKGVYFGRIDEDTPFKPYEATIGGAGSPTVISTSGGIIESNQRLYIYGNGGLVYYTERNEPQTILSGSYSAGGSLKLLAARPWRGNLLFWSPEVLYLGQFSADLKLLLTPVTSITIASPSSIIDGRNSTYYWMGLNQMYAYNGALSVFQNDNNRNYLYEHLNRSYLGNCWGMYLEGFTEIAWFVPQGTDKEASLGIFHNTEEKTWYKTILNRSCGITTGVAPYPVMADNKTLPFFSNDYPVWYHDKGVNQKVGDQEYPIEAWVESKMFSIYLENVSANIALLLRRYEKNINQTGDMFLEVKHYNYPDSEPVALEKIKFTPETTNINFAKESSLFSFKFSSNALNGFYQFGPLVINYENGNTRPTTSDIT